MRIDPTGACDNISHRTTHHALGIICIRPVSISKSPTLCIVNNARGNQYDQFILLSLSVGCAEKLTYEWKVSKNRPFGHNLKIRITDHPSQNESLAISNANCTSIKTTNSQCLNSATVWNSYRGWRCCADRGTERKRYKSVVIYLVNASAKCKPSRFKLRRTDVWRTLNTRNNVKGCNFLHTYGDIRFVSKRTTNSRGSQSRARSCTANLSSTAHGLGILT